ncbi:MAG: hypothetical protein OEM30_10295, partial [Gammaproteobacteria bacterium]|nr:hypothetical protein [Gammaproteobacteria bacterium]
GTLNILTCFDAPERRLDYRDILDTARESDNSLRLQDPNNAEIFAKIATSRFWYSAEFSRSKAHDTG